MTTPLWRRYLRFWGADPAADVDDEFAFHLEMRIEELGAGAIAEAARDEALRGFGNIQDVKRVCRTLADEREDAMRRTEWWSDWRHDCRFAVRQLTVSPVLTAVLVLTIALGIGSTVAIFSVLYAVLLRPLPGTDSERIVWIYETLQSRGRTGSASVGHFHDWTEQGTVFEDTAAGSRGSFNLSDGEPERVSGMQVTPGYFRVIHIDAVLGRLFTETDVARDSRLVIVGHGLWQRRFAKDPSIVGRTIQIYGEAHTVIGIAPPEYGTTRFAPQIWTPLVFSPQQRANYGSHSFAVIAKLKPGVTLSAAQADMERVTRGIAERGAGTWRAVGSTSRPTARSCSAAPSVRDSTCCSRPSRWCCSSDASTSPTCCWRARRHAVARSQSAPPSAEGGGESFVSCSPKASYWRSSAASPVSPSPTLAFACSSDSVHPMCRACRMPDFRPRC